MSNEKTCQVGGILAFNKVCGSVGTRVDMKGGKRRCHYEGRCEHQSDFKLSPEAAKLKESYQTIDRIGLLAFIEQIEAAEREACAQVCEEHRFRSLGLAAAIRARGNK